MSEMIVRTAQTPEIRRAQIEMRIHDDLNRMGDSYIDIGRCLNVVKDEGLVPHGEWQDWVAEHAQMNPRNAQRVMKAAREIDEKSPLARLDFTKVMALLALPAEEREAFAETVQADRLTVRQLQDAVRARKEAENALEAMNRERLDAVRRANSAEKERKKQEQDLLGRLETATDRVDELNREIEAQEEEIRRRARLDRAADAGRRGRGRAGLPGAGGRAAAHAARAGRHTRGRPDGVRQADRHDRGVVRPGPGRAAGRGGDRAVNEITKRDPAGDQLMSALGEMGDLMRAMAESVRLTNLRMQKLERQIELMTPLTGAQDKALGEAIRKRADALCEQYRLRPARAGAVATAIRRELKRQSGVRSTRELPRIEYQVLLERVALWDDYDVMREIRRADREERLD